MYNVYKRMTSSATRKSSFSFKLAAVSYTVASTAANCSHSYVSGNNQIMHFINFSIALVFVIASGTMLLQFPCSASSDVSSATPVR